MEDENYNEEKPKSEYEEWKEEDDARRFHEYQLERKGL